jgi:Caspase domain
MPAARDALIVACSEYADSGLAQLRAPAHDARALAEVLQDPEIGDFTVSLVLDQPEYLVRRQVAAFFANRSPQDTLLAHFSCHGVKDESGQLYFAASDTELTALDATALPAEFVNKQMNKSRSRRIALLLDCCYSGAFARGMQHRAGEGLELRERFEGRGRAVLTASSAMEYAFDGDTLTRSEENPSVFTSAVVQGLRTGDADRDGDGYITVDELYEYVYDEVRQRTPSQTPHRWSFDVEGDLFIATAAAPAATNLPNEVRAGLASPYAGARLEAIKDLARLLAGSHRGLSAAARETLEILRSTDDSLSVREAATAVLGSDGAIRATQARAPDEREEREGIERQRRAEEEAKAEQARAAAEREERERIERKRNERQRRAEEEARVEQARADLKREERERVERQAQAAAEREEQLANWQRRAKETEQARAAEARRPRPMPSQPEGRVAQWPSRSAVVAVALAALCCIFTAVGIFAYVSRQAEDGASPNPFEVFAIAAIPISIIAIVFALISLRAGFRRNARLSGIALFGCLISLVALWIYGS